MLDKKQIKFIKGFLIEYGMTRKEFAKEAGIGLRTLYKAISTGDVSKETYEKIVAAMLCETLQRKIIVKPLMPKRETPVALKISLVVSAIAAAALASCLF